MESLYFLIPISLFVCILAVAIFFWAVNNGQYEDLDGEAERILFDDEDDLDPATEVEADRDEKSTASGINDH